MSVTSQMKILKPLSRKRVIIHRKSCIVGFITTVNPVNREGHFAPLYFCTNLLSISLYLEFALVKTQNKRVQILHVLQTIIDKTLKASYPLKATNHSREANTTTETAAVFR